MRYPEFRRQELFVGSGVVEAACKIVFASRLKRPACSGRFAAPTPSLPCVAAESAASSRITGGCNAYEFSLPYRAPRAIRKGLGDVNFVV
jgi:hypothetical protein